MTLSYSIGLTCGSAVAYLLDAMLGAHVDHDLCAVYNTTTSVLVSTIMSRYNTTYSMSTTAVTEMLGNATSTEL